MLNTFQNATNIVRNDLIRISENRYTLAVEKSSASLVIHVRFCALMHIAIKFNAKFQLMAEEIKNVWTYGMLSSEF